MPLAIAVETHCRASHYRIIYDMTNLEKLNAYIEKHNLRHTTEREMMLKHIEGINGHFTASELIDTFGKENNVSNATIYRNLNLLEDAYIVTKHQFPVPEAVYELSTRAATHYHRICTSCGEVKEFRDAQASSALKSHRFRGFDMRSANIYIYGTCKKCKINKKHK